MEAGAAGAAGAGVVTEAGVELVEGMEAGVDLVAVMEVVGLVMEVEEDRTFLYHHLPPEVAVDVYSITREAEEVGDVAVVGVDIHDRHIMLRDIHCTDLPGRDRGMELLGIHYGGLTGTGILYG